MSVSVRQATPKDIPHILRLYDAGLREMGETNIKESLLLNKIVNSYHLAPCFLLIIDDKIRGMAGFTVMATSHNGTASLCDYMFYIQPEHRGIRTVKSLVEEVLKFSSEKNIPLILGFITDASLASKVRLAEICGLTIRGVICTNGLQENNKR